MSNLTFDQMSKISTKKQAKEWIKEVVADMPTFLSSIRVGNKYKYSLSGDVLPHFAHWGLANAVFYLKTLTIMKKYVSNYEQQVEEAVAYIESFEKNNYYFDQYVALLSLPLRGYATVKFRDFKYINNEYNKIAETRQSIAAIKPYVEVESPTNLFPSTKKTMHSYLSSLDWDRPWHAGSQFSHTLFYIKNSNLSNREELIASAIDFITSLQKKDGFWYNKKTSNQQKINGAMKVISGLKAIDQVRFSKSKNIIDLCLASINDAHACDDFNIIYVLHYCLKQLDTPYRQKDIERFVVERLNFYKQHYHKKQKGFSFFKNKSNILYYNAPLTWGKKEPDIHGTMLYMWGLSIVVQLLKLEDEIKLQEVVT